MHTAALHLAPILGAEKSKVPFYIAGGLLVAWALIVSLGLGMRRPDFPGDLTGQRAVMAITAVLVLAAVSTAVITSGGGTAKAGANTGSTPAAAPQATTGTPAPSSSPAPNAAGGSLKLSADAAGGLSYDTKQLSAKTGTVTITMTNASPLEHNVTIAQG
ncbi:MAG TPA: hypothetical protein VES97_04550, partial [Solirubrobacteraceae bacterium]|nr:hypothetical protein [Solirubrobacteraceae bacterium]